MIFSEEKLIDKKFFEKIKILSDDIINEDRFREAYDLSKNLELSINKIIGFKDKNFELYHNYKEIIIKLKWLGLPIMSEDKAVDMFQYHFADIFKIPEYEVWPKLRIILMNITIFEDRDKFKSRLRQALLNNEQKLTAKKFINNQKKVRPTVGNWVLNYNGALSTAKVDDLGRIEYMIKNKNIIILDDDEKKRVKILFDLYEKLKLSSLVLEGIEEDIPVDEENMRGTISAGVFEPFKETEKQKQTWQIIQNFLREREKDVKVKSGEKLNINGIEELKKLVLNYPAGSFERKAIEEEIEKMNHES